MTRFINRWEKNRMMREPKTWMEQKLGDCPHKEPSSLVGGKSARCDGPKCQLWLRQEAREDSPGNCAHNIGALNQAQTAAQINAIGQMLSQIGALVHLQIKLMAKASPALQEDYEKLVAGEQEPRQ